MKKKLLILLLLTCLLLVGCGEPVDMDINDFQNYASENGMDILDGTDQIDVDYVNQIIVSENDDVHIEMWDISDEASASKWYNDNVLIVKKSESSHTETNVGHVSRYNASCNGTYYVIIKNGDDAIYAYGDKDELSNMLSSMGF